MEKTLVGVVIVLSVLLLVGFVGSLYYFTQVNPPQAYEDAVLEKLKRVEELAKDPVIVSAVQSTALEHEGITQEEITRLDNQWRATEGVSEFINQFLTNETADVLIKFQEKEGDFPEIFVTDVYGLNVGQTNKTTDYYQADEGWWVKAYNSGDGKSYYGDIEYDESARAWSTPLYVPVRAGNGEVIGVVKALLDASRVR